MTGAAFNRGASKQDYTSPQELIDAIEQRFGIITFDLAASAENTKAAAYYDEAADSLVQPWAEHGGLLYLNPPYGNIKPWAEKCEWEARDGARIALLVPAAVGSVWFSTFVHGRALVLALQPRVSFDGKNPYPKDVMLALYGPRHEVPWVPGFDVWRWK